MTSAQMFESAAVKPGDVIEVRRRYVVTKRRWLWLATRRVGTEDVRRIATEGTP